MDGKTVKRLLAFSALAYLSIAGCARDPHYGEATWSIQGIYSQLDCHTQPGKRPSYVTVLGEDGQYHDFFLQCVGDDEGPGMDISRLAKTDRVWVLTNTGDNIQSLPAKVPHIEGGTPLVCFRIHSQQYVDCFYRSDADGHVIVKHVASNLTEV